MGSDGFMGVTIEVKEGPFAVVVDEPWYRLPQGTVLSGTLKFGENRFGESRIFGRSM